MNLSLYFLLLGIIGSEEYISRSGKTEKKDPNKSNFIAAIKFAEKSCLHKF